MKRIKDELQYIICGDEQTGFGSQLKKTQVFLRGYAETSPSIEKQQRFKDKETAALLIFAEKENLFYHPLISANDFISEGAEQKVYMLDGDFVIKTNQGIFYESWLDYFNNLLIHNFLFQHTAYTFLGFKIINETLHAVVKQEYIGAAESPTFEVVKRVLEYNGFLHKRNNDYFNPDVGLILEDLHDENVILHNNILYFVDTIFYLTPTFYA